MFCDFMVSLRRKQNISEQMSCFKCGTSSGNVNASSFSGFNITSNMQAALTDQVDVAINDTTSAEDFDALHDWMDNQLADLAKHDHNDVDGYLSLQDNNKDTVSQDVTGLDFQISSLHDSDDDHHDDHTMDHNFIREVLYFVSVYTLTLYACNVC